MAWQEITLRVTADRVTVFEEALWSLGALSVTLRDAAHQPLLEPAPGMIPLWDHVLLTAMFELTADADAVCRQLRPLMRPENMPACEVTLLQDREWWRAWMAHFKPTRFGRRLWICPGGYESPRQRDAVVIEPDPGLAFGTGSHPTTALCLQWLDGHSVPGRRVVDFGCGSGAPAIAAAKSGAARVFAVDDDPQALQAAANAGINGVAGRVTVCEARLAAPASADILLANILLQPLLSLRAEFTRLLKPRGRIVLSGLLTGQRQPLQLAYGHDFCFDTCEQMQE